ncbi:signal transduction histidine kinase [Nocardioides thalensis]|uniref:histidine kinase n=1 Tax=Nocardioides thalensis TaxID=1914755 RepID=A0A853C9A9_9ACTN|nr:sensor domain-containing protein [Nocardioides thalensis]NYJ03028.1 signal transduction histidine kinase [Nocardioides thalensis]
MRTSPDAWAAVRGRPWEFLASWWPWRSIGYLLTTVPVGMTVLVSLVLLLGVGVVTLVVVVGVVVLAAIPRVTGGIGILERARVRLVLPRDDGGAAPTLRERLLAGRGLRVSWSEIGYAVLLAGVLWVVDALVLLFTITTAVVLLLAPYLVRFDTLGMLGWDIDSTREAWVAFGLGIPTTVAAAYVVTGVACGQAALARLLLDPPEHRLVQAVADLRRSRVDLVGAFETERRRIERDLHDGVQQRLLALTMTLGRAELDVPEGPGLDLLREAHEQAEAALEELRFTVRGIHPRVLTDHGLAAAVDDIADRSPVPVDTTIMLPGRLPAPVEAAAYFVVSEALTNVARHARARSVRVRAWVERDRLVLTVVDDGDGGADPASGSGLAGLALRLEALDGTLDVHSPPGGPTEVRMECPIDAG